MFIRLSYDIQDFHKIFIVHRVSTGMFVIIDQLRDHSYVLGDINLGLKTKYILRCLYGNKEVKKETFVIIYFLSLDNNKNRSH